jgi:uncharacterized protein YggE
MSFSFMSRGVLGFLVVLVSLSLGACAHHRGRHHGPQAAGAPPHGIVVSGTGQANGTPDVARSTLGVEVRAGSAEEAIAEVNKQMGQVVAALKQAGVADADIRTNTLSLNFERNYEQHPPPPYPVEPLPPAPEGKPSVEPQAKVATAAPAPKLPQGFYTATNNVEVTLRDLNRAGAILTAATSAGANQVYGIQFEVEDPSPLLSQAREKAVADAQKRAQELARLAGVKLGPAVSITEQDGGMHGPMPAFNIMKSAESAPIERGAVTVTSSVQIVYELGE